MASYVLIQNQVIEVFGDEDEGFPDCWFGAFVIELVSKDEALVQYSEFLDDKDGLPLRETVPLERIRPAPQAELAHFESMKDVRVGFPVESYYDDCWWRGIVTSIHPAGVRWEDNSGNNMFVRDHRLLRPSVELVKGCWRRVVPTPSELTELGIDSKKATAARQALRSAPPLPLGQPRLRSSAGGAAPAAAAAAAQLLPSQTGKPLLSPLRRRQGGGGGGTTPRAGTSAAGTSAAATSARRLERELDGGEPMPGAEPAAERQLPGEKRRREPSSPAEEESESDEDVIASEDKDRDDEAAAGPSRGRPPKAAGAAAAETARITRPRREGMNRVVYVNGHPVLKENMYGLHDEDTMKWQRDFKTGQASMEGLDLEPRQPRVLAPKPPAQTEKPKPAKQHPPEFQARLDHNAAIRRDSKVSELSRARYLVKHLDKLRPFITPQVEAQLRAAASSAARQQQQPGGAEPVTQQPDEILATLREYQQEGLAWLVEQSDRGVNAILADEMGLGKTLQTITFLAYLKFVRRVEGPHLIVVPLSVLSSWMSEFKRWCPSMRVIRLHCTDPDERKRLVREVLGNPASFDVAVTTYDMVNSQHFGNCLKHHLVWRYLVLDEGHKVKNEKTKVSHGMAHIARQQVLMLTGTPVQNNLHELFALLNFLYPDIFTDPSRFDEAFNLSKGKVDARELEAAHHLLRPFMLRRLKEEVEVSLPPKLETRIQCPLAHMQTFWYRRLLLKDCKLLQEMEATDAQDAKKAASAPSEGSDWKKAMNLLMQLRKVCNHPFMFKDAEPHFDSDAPPPEELVTGSGKMMVLDRLLDRLQERGHRVVLFSQFNIMLDIIEDYLSTKGLNYRRLDGSTNRIQRMVDMQQFNKPGSDIFIYILCTRAGGLGVNLQTADTCILFDSDWNPQWDLQAMARVHRIGQTRPVHVYRLVTGGTVEERIQGRAEAKLYLDQMVNRGSTSNAEQLEGLTTGEVLSMLRFGADRIFQNEEGAMPSDAELDAIMDRSRMVADAEAAKVKEEEEALKVKEEEGGSAAAGVGPEAGAGAALAADGAGTMLDVSPGAGAAAGAGGSGSGNGSSGGAALLEHKQSALAFDAEAPPVDTFMFQGMDFRALRSTAARDSMRDIASEFWEHKRERKARLVEVDGYQVLRDNNYTMQEGMLHYPGQQRNKGPGRPKKMQRAGVDYDHMDYCLICWDGGELLCCDHCPAAFHAACLGFDEKQAREAEKRNWTCPHHRCDTCDRNTAKAGGLLFRCEMCSNSYCEDDLPAGYHMVGECELFKSLGQRHPRQACFIHCSDRCKELSQELQPRIQACTPGNKGAGSKNKGAGRRTKGSGPSSKDTGPGKRPRVTPARLLL
ncbi:hypothetical protein PLESTB_001026800 [Pleodorina starrii]|uniref:Uncharacterized protein n=1 Tax=Pleodorina starrii TaxID=330485 RepID=A0A9W6F429_9CHLO|nr:hypothetical protein PLESTM_001815300 [Pleodorina starrii]GLC55768.1 hypothetical protein PLESTB_001026800 [Pleodorina starrii]GLC68840.1 hypothetical protein PLESTF_000744300 [Pleodorina starrii]